MNAEELRAAAIRRRTNDWLGNRMYNDFVDEDADARLLADAYLAEHHADDAEPITLEWLRSVGFQDGHTKRRSLVAGVIYVCPPYGPAPWWCGIKSSNQDVYAQITKFATRGQIRRLATALSIPLTEDAR